MFKKKSKAYVVWVGRQTGVFTSWPHVNSLIERYPGSRYKGFTSVNEANMMWNIGFEEYEKGRVNTKAPEKVVHKVKVKVDAAITARSRMLVSNFTDPRTKSGSHTTTCTSAACTYPNCQCT